MAIASRHRPVGSFLTRSRASARPALEALEVRLAPAVYTVTSALDDGSAGTLRACITQANSTAGVADTIAIETNQPIVLTGQLQITDAVAIVGVAGRASIERTGGQALFGLFDITSKAGNVTLANLELTGGHAPSTGGAVSNAANLTLQDCWIHGNAADETGAGVYTTGALTIADCTLQANSVAKGGYGGGVSVDSANLFVTGTTFQDNQADRGGGVYFQTSGSPVTVDFRDCTFSGNQATAGDGGALATSAVGTLTAAFLDCTLADNTSSGGNGVGGVYAYPNEGSSTHFTYQGTLFANNSSASLGGGGSLGIDYFLTSQGHNLSTDGVGMTQKTDLVTSDPGLGTLGDYGGPTPTIPLMDDSPALDAGVVIAGISTDQRGVSRPQGSAPDIGAFEVRPQRIALATGDAFANVDVAFSRSGSVTGDGDATVFVDYGDSNGAPESPVPYGPGSTFTLSHAYAAEGTYDVTVSLVDGNGKTMDTLQFRVDVFLDGVSTGQIDEETTSGPGVVTSKATEPHDGSSVTATLSHLSPNTASILVATVPTSVASALNGSPQIAGDTITSAYDVRAVGVGIGDEILVVFHYANNNIDQPVLRYYNRATGQEGVVSSDTYVVDPAAETITLILDAGSTPGILDISGTVFTIAVPLAVSVSPDANAVSSLERGGSGGGFGTGGGGGGGSGGAFSASFQVTGNPAVVFASFTSPSEVPADGPFATVFAAPDKTNLLAELPLVPDRLITLPGPILTPGSTETPVPNEPPKVTTPSEGGAPATSRLDDPEDDAVDEVFIRFDEDGSALQCYPLLSRTAGGEGGESPADWRDSSLAVAAFLAARPAVAVRRPFANRPDER